MPSDPNRSSADIADLFSIGAEAAEAWSPADLASVWKHQLAQSVSPDLVPAEQNPGALTFGQLLAHTTPDEGILIHLKNFARMCLKAGTLPPPVATALYFASIGIARARARKTITTLSPDEVDAGMAWLATQSWLDQSIFTDLADRSSASLADGESGQGNQSVSQQTQPANDDLPAISVAGAVIVDAKAQPASDIPVLEGYRITGPLGGGGMGQVWKAEQLSTRREVALKLMRGEMFSNSEHRKRFEREVELTARLEHPHIARIYDSGLRPGNDNGHDGQDIYFYAMELIRGAPLDQFVRDQKLTTRQILELIRTICLAVQFAHQNGIIHRDLKPSNIFVCTDGQPRVLDFGLARGINAIESTGVDSHKSAADMEITAAGRVSGTPAYMAPEQATDGLNVDTRADIYALGIILYRQLTGHTPYGGDPKVSLILRVIRHEIREPTELDRELRAIVLKSMALEREDRYSSAADFARDISAYLNGDAVQAVNPTLAYEARKFLWKRRVPVAIVLAVALMLASVIAVAYRNVVRERDRAIANEAQSLINEGNSQASLNQWTAAKSRYDEAEHLQESVGASTVRAQLLRWKAECVSPSPLMTFDSPSLSATCAAVLDGGKYLAVGTQDGQVRIHDSATGRAVRSFDLPANQSHGVIQNVRSIHNGEQILAASDDGVVRVWDRRSGQAVFTLRAPGLVQVAVSPDQARAITVGGFNPEQDTQNFHLLLWDLATGAQLAEIGKSESLGSVAATFSADGQSIFTVGSRAIRKWKLDGTASGDPLPIDTGETLVVACSDDGLLATTGTDRQVILRNLSTNQEKRLSAHTADICHLAFAKDHRLLSTDEGGTSILWDTTHGSEVRRLLRGQPHASASPDARVNVSEDGHFVAVTDEAGFINVWRTDSVEGDREIAQPTASADALYFARNQTLAVARLTDDTVQAWDIQRATPARLSGSFTAVPAMACSSDGEWIACAKATGIEISSLFDPPSSALVRGSVVGRTGSIVALSRAGLLAAVSHGGAIDLVEARNGNLSRTIPADAHVVNAISFGSDSAKLVSGGDDGAAAIWDTSTGQLIARTSPDAGATRPVPVTSLAWAANGKWIAIGGNDGSLKLWDGQTTQHSLAGHTAAVRTTAFSEDGALLVSWDSDGKCILWDVESGTQILRLTDLPADVGQAVFSHDGQQLLCAGTSADNQAQIRLLDFHKPAAPPHQTLSK